MDAKRTLYQAIVRNLAPLGVPALDIKITLIETAPENWGCAAERLRPKLTSASRSRCSALGVASRSPDHARTQTCLRA